LNWALGKWRNEGGHDVYPYFCKTCKRRLSLYEKKEIAEAIGFILIDQDVKRTCVKCGTSGAENHHWAPGEYFEDSDAWPQDYLCQKCHSTWHAVINKFARKNKSLEDKNLELMEKIYLLSGGKNEPR
jgi:transposase-like protein